MDMMLLGETIHSDVSASGSTTFYGFWMPAGGSDGVAAIETFLVVGTNVLVVHLETKSSDSDDSGASSIGNVTISSTTPQIYKFDVTNAKDLVRYAVACGGNGAAHLQFMQPLWSPN